MSFEQSNGPGFPKQLVDNPILPNVLRTNNIITNNVFNTPTDFSNITIDLLTVPPRTHPSLPIDNNDDDDENSNNTINIKRKIATHTNVTSTLTRTLMVPLIHIPLYFGSVGIDCLVDTGAQVSLISFSVFAIISDIYKKLLKLEDEIYTTFLSASGTRMQPVGLFEMTVTMSELFKVKVAHPFYIVRELNEKCILGLDFITAFNMIFHPSLRTLTYSVKDTNDDIKTYTMRLPQQVNTCSVSVAPKHNFDISHIKDETQRNALEDFFQKHNFAFAYSMADLRCAKGVEHEIRTTGNPVALPIRRLAHTLRPIVKEQIDSMLANGIIRESCSPWAAPVVMTPKKAPGEWRFCVDYRWLNKQSIPDKYPIPRLDDALAGLYGSRFFTTLDLFAGYHQIMVKAEDQKKTAFICEFGLYEYIRLPFGLTNGPATFQRHLNHVLRSVLYKFVLSYLDDLIIFSRTFSEHIEHLSVVAHLIYEAGLRFHPKKCFFAKELIEYLGHIISSMGILPDPRKLQAIIDFPAPMTVKQIQTFLGMVNFYRKHVFKISELAHPLTQLTRKSVPWQWGEYASFRTLTAQERRWRSLSHITRNICQIGKGVIVPLRKNYMRSFMQSQCLNRIFMGSNLRYTVITAPFHISITRRSQLVGLAAGR